MKKQDIINELKRQKQNFEEIITKNFKEKEKDMLDMAVCTSESAFDYAIWLVENGVEE